MEDLRGGLDRFIEYGSLQDDASGTALVIGWAIGCSLGSAIGVYSAGSMGEETGSFAETLGGGLLGGFLAGLLAVGGEEWIGAAIVGGLILPPISAAIVFNGTRRYKSPSESALINFGDGQMSLAVPSVYLQPDSFGRGSLSQSVDLLRMRF